MGCCGSRDYSDNKNYDFAKTHQFEMVYAIKNKDKSAVESLLADGFPVNFNMSRFNGTTPLHKAAEFGAKEILTELLNAKANVDDQDNGGLTPIFYAVKAKDWDSMRLLLKKGANVNHKSKYLTKLEDCMPSDEKERSKYMQELKVRGYIPKEDSNAQRDIEDDLFEDMT
jgi:ankyrin repeat protein